MILNLRKLYIFATLFSDSYIAVSNDCVKYDIQQEKQLLLDIQVAYFIFSPKLIFKVNVMQDALKIKHNKSKPIKRRFPYAGA